MIHNFLSNIVRMVVLITLGTINLFTALSAPRWWLLAICMLVALFAYFVAWLCYRDAMKIAKALDEPTKINVTIIEWQPGDDGAIRGQDTAETPKTNEHEDIGHPV